MSRPPHGSSLSWPQKLRLRRMYLGYAALLQSRVHLAGTSYEGSPHSSKCIESAQPDFPPPRRSCLPGKYHLPRSPTSPCGCFFRGHHRRMMFVAERQSDVNSALLSECRMRLALVWPLRSNNILRRRWSRLRILISRASTRISARRTTQASVRKLHTRLHTRFPSLW
ncbi:hypothetical protein FB451DRAFT_1255097 [Mycena latifolia]|nr:hypothetical protein FB451DRAFT_1255097 [Mycena latifolia]